MKKTFSIILLLFTLSQLALGSPSRSQKHGSSFKLANQQGLTIKENDFDAYGNVTREQDWVSDNFPSEFGGSKNDLLFGTKERDASTGLDNFGFRYYDAVLRKFITRDPSGYPDGPNNYLYVNNNPINSIDPLGLWSLKGWIKEKAQAVKSVVKQVAKKTVEVADKTLVHASNAAAGFGDTISMGLTQKARESMGTDEVVDKSSAMYKTGEVWEKSHTNHNADVEWEVGLKPGQSPRPKNKITVNGDGTVIKVDN